jgi:hypothetical protein
MKLLNTQENEKVKQAICDYYELNEKHKQQEEEFKSQKNKLETYISNFLFSNGVEKLRFRATQGNRFGQNQQDVECKKIIRRSVIFDIDRLKQRLGKERCLEFIDKEYQINDMDGLVKLLKKSGVNPKDFKKFIDVNEVVNTKKLDKLKDIGDITLEELKGCYTVEELSSYIKVNAIDEE